MLLRLHPMTEDRIILFHQDRRSSVPDILFWTEISTTYTDMLSRSFEEANPNTKKVPSKDGEKCLKDFTFDSSVHNQEMCPITQLPFEDGDVITMLPC